MLEYFIHTPCSGAYVCVVCGGGGGEERGGSQLASIPSVNFYLGANVEATVVNSTGVRCELRFRCSGSPPSPPARCRLFPVGIWDNLKADVCASPRCNLGGQALKPSAFPPKREMRGALSHFKLFYCTAAFAPFYCFDFTILVVCVWCFLLSGTIQSRVALRDKSSDDT